MPNLVDRLARSMAVLGGIVMTILVVLIFVSVVGRGLNTFGNSDWLEQSAPGFAVWLIDTGVRPITGDFEIVESGIAFAIFCFFPICQLYGGHAAVDVFTQMMPPFVTRFLQTLWEVVMSAVLILIAVQLFKGMVEKFHNGQTSFLLEFPIWWAYAASFCAALIAVGVGLYVAGARVVEMTSGRAILPGSEGAMH